MSNRDELIKELELQRDWIEGHGDLYVEAIADLILSREANNSLTTVSVDWHKKEVDRIVGPLVKVMNYYEGYPPEDACNKAIDQTLKKANLL